VRTAGVPHGGADPDGEGGVVVGSFGSAYVWADAAPAVAALQARIQRLRPAGKQRGPMRGQTDDVKSGRGKEGGGTDGSGGGTDGSDGGTDGPGGGTDGPGRGTDGPGGGTDGSVAGDFAALHLHLGLALAQQVTTRNRKASVKNSHGRDKTPPPAIALKQTLTEKRLMAIPRAERPNCSKSSTRFIQPCFASAVPGKAQRSRRCLCRRNLGF
jgi:hypothetical protein